ncbi:Cysteine synthase [Fundidesulfovibrio magnetotacticus]|uniref:cysteine synthase n=1 Tax=Fundidesulfovibrio magnetotacticus TaxID=2730080 RepID=A0A6V8LTM8_9BACT|nr:cysteine synthase [Fundidesulfovibrio magnetotacticus]GFK94290.1 Cysteine synthase [Fundidesulfovibrio magnetotacticus]
MAHPDILSLAGDTPLVAIRRLNPNPAVGLVVKLEAKNPGGSIKDRVALAMIDAALDSGELTPEKTVIEATSGNTGIGLAMVCAVKGLRLTLVMPSSASEERKRIMRAYGAELMLTPGQLGTDGAIEEAYRLAREHPERYVLMDQFNNPASIEAHYRGTGREIWEQTGGAVTHVVATLGTSGTVMGIAKALKELNPSVKVVAVEPRPGHRIQGLKNMQESYPPGIYDKRQLGAVVAVEDEEAFEMARRLAREEGILAGMSGGAAMAAAVHLCGELESGLVVVILPDGGERYLSTTLFAPPQAQGARLKDIATGKPVHLSSGPAGLYTPGPSLDAPAGAEAWRRAVTLDVLARSVRASGGEALLAVGMADMDDRALAAARAACASLDACSEQTRAEMVGLADDLGVRAVFPAASGALERMLEITRALMRKGLCYEKLRSVYFDVARDKAYGSLSHADMAKLALGKTVDLAAYLKDNPQDFTLLKRVSLQDLKLGQVVQTEWGSVRPSWFLQMAACPLAALPRVSAVLAGEGQVFPDLENLRAIWSLAAATRPEAWMACGSVRRDAAEPDLRETARVMGGYRAVRLWLLSVHYRRALDASDKTLAMWSANWRKLRDTAANLAHVAHGAEQASAETLAAVETLRRELDQAVEDDLSLHHFWPKLFAFCRAANSAAAGKKAQAADAAARLEGLKAVDSVLGVLDESRMPLSRTDWPEEAARLDREREKARKAKDFASADALRADIEALGFRTEDTAAGLRLYAAPPGLPGGEDQGAQA